MQTDATHTKGTAGRPRSSWYRTQTRAWEKHPDFGSDWIEEPRENKRTHEVEHLLGIDREEGGVPDPRNVTENRSRGMSGLTGKNRSAGIYARAL